MKLDTLVLEAIKIIKNKWNYFLINYFKKNSFLIITFHMWKEGDIKASEKNSHHKFS